MNLGGGVFLAPFGCSLVLAGAAIATNGAQAPQEPQSAQSCQEAYREDTRCIDQKFHETAEACSGPGDAPCFREAVKEKAELLQLANAAERACNKARQAAKMDPSSGDIDDESKRIAEGNKKLADWTGRWDNQAFGKLGAITQKDLQPFAGSVYSWDFDATVYPDRVLATLNDSQSVRPPDGPLGQAYDRMTTKLARLLQTIKPPAFPRGSAYGATRPIPRHVHFDTSMRYRRGSDPPLEPDARADVDGNVRSSQVTGVVLYKPVCDPQGTPPE
jgi:hypothetical protein